ALIRYREGQIAEAETNFSCIGVLALGIECRCDRRKDAALQPGRGHSVWAKRRFEIHCGHRMERIELDVVFAAPDHFHGLARFLLKNRFFDDEVAERFAAESST